ncbi:MAG TPA: PUA domain-containing protein [Natrialbaceae archaeon]|nr:PUA domain-containing protein [Natrialbaceae archaeon]
MNDDTDVAQLRTIADYQFGRGAGRGLFPADETREYKRTTSGRVAQVIADEGRLVSLGVDGRFTLGFAGGKRLLSAFDPPTCRVSVGEESEPFVRDGRNAFAKFVTAADDAIRPGDEVVVVDGDDAPLGVGRAELSAAAMADFDTGMAVTIREGADS